MRKTLITIFLFSGIAFSLMAQRKLAVIADKPLSPVSPEMWGIFFEDINFAADGGLYAELVKNRSFEFPAPLMGWKEIRKDGAGKILLINEEQSTANKRFVRVTANSGVYGLNNEGFRGMGIHAGKRYRFSVMVRTEVGSPRLKIQLENKNGKILGEASLTGFTNNWKIYTTEIQASDTAEKAGLNVLLEGPGSLDIDMVSLFPVDTWKNRPNGLRADLVQLLADLHPGFIRFPGGCIVEGRDLANRYQWKKTVGDPSSRELIINRWNTEFRHKLTPDYFQSFGLGFFEYFQLAEDIGAQPLPILNCGMACQYNTGELASLADLDPYIKDALDLIEFANGDSSTAWGKLRSAMGHPQPFHLKFLGIGNEQWDEQYIERYKLFEKVLQEKHPEIKLVSGAGPSPDGKLFDYAWKELKQTKTALVDEHYYKDPQWFFNNATRYDQYERKGPKVFAGEYAAHVKEEPQAESRNSWGSALAEAAFMTGLERNADIVQMASYAPLLAHIEAWQWRPDLIWFDNLRSIATPNYYVQQLFASNKGTHTVALLEDGKAITGRDSLYGSAVIDRDQKELILKLVNASNTAMPLTIDLGKISPAKQPAKVLYVTADRSAYNTLDTPQAVKPEERSMDVKQNKVNISVAAGSLMVIRIPCKKI